jgi:hypothetical protein
MRRKEEGGGRPRAFIEEKWGGNPFFDWPGWVAGLWEKGGSLTQA